MEPDLSRFEITPEGIASSENTGIFNPVSRQDHMNASTPPLRSPAPAGATPRMPTGSLATDNELMASYISSPHPDLPNQYNIIIAGDDDDDDDDVISQTLNSPQANSMDMELHNPGSVGEQSMSEQAMGAIPYRSYTVQFKLNALDWYYKNGENKNLTAKMFNVDRKRIRDWLLDERNLRSDPTPQRTKRKRANSLPQYKDIEDALYKFYVAQREKGIRPKNAELRAKSLEFASVLGYRETFKASIHWLCNWKRRNKISFAVPDHVIQSANEEDDDSGSATPPFMEERLGRIPPQTYKVGRVSNYGVEGVQSAAGGNGGVPGYVQNSASSGGNVQYVQNSVSSRSSPGSSSGIMGRVGASSDGSPISRTSNGAGISGRTYSGVGIDPSSLAMSRNTSGNVGGGGYGGVDGLMSTRNLSMDGVGLGVSLGERRREATHHINEQSDEVDDVALAGLSGLSYSAIPTRPVAKEHDASEHWMDLLEQSVLSLESDVARKFSQIKLLLHQIKKSRQPAHSNSDTPNAMSSHSPANRLPSHSQANRLPPQARTQTK